VNLDPDCTGGACANDEENNGQDKEDNTGIERFNEWHGKLLRNGRLYKGKMV